ncbi:ATP-dependent DNA helicase PcrA [Actinomyces sp. 2119]|uniref:ATP-dependent helicase n=1 Tax=Actinomyces sp. 2119 TaxID=2321393 RepID=UPI000E6C3F11|nr:UvrD-helicase domain-containing protein [Actinomyces sp. 2119]RJF43227.1 ATP-dependent DNA helicase PcrA [Actinomyces sp. 2119]
MTHATNALFGNLSMPGTSRTSPPAEAALPSLATFDDDSWADVEPPDEEDLEPGEGGPQDWVREDLPGGARGTGTGEYPVRTRGAGPVADHGGEPAEDRGTAPLSWEERQAVTAGLVARAQADASAARAQAEWSERAEADLAAAAATGGAEGLVRPGAGSAGGATAGREPVGAVGTVRTGYAGHTGAPRVPWGVTVADPASLVEGLNPAQAQAVTHSGSPLLIIAGAGSGKTRVLTHRVAHLIATGRARPGEILAITFTNKAAAEMRERVTALVGPAGERMWVSTFHSACVRILRRSHEAAGLRSTFSVYDAADSTRLITLIVRELGIDPKRFTPKTFAHRISDLKNELVTPEELARTAQPTNPMERHLVEVYQAYAQRLAAANALDFDDIIMRTVALLQTQPAVAEAYRRRFRHVLVDEYQDTNHAQYVLVRELVGGPGTSGEGSPLPAGELTVVGDSDQSIYAFRGATIRNIEEFEQDYPSARTILLEQNYRSTQNILTAANTVISRNSGRRPKNLWTSSGDGAPVTGYVADSEHDEARWVSQEIDRLADEHGVRPAEVAVFYRTNAQSRALEEVFVRSGQPYKVVGGTRFYERREVKDAIAYLRAVDNPDDDVNLRRILNVPRRGLGDKAEAALAEHASRHAVSFGRAVADAAGVPREDPARQGDDEPPVVEGLTTRARNQVRGFHELLVSLRQMLGEGQGVAEVLDSALDASGYLAELRASDDPQDATRVENLAELHSVASDFQAANPTGTLADFLERVSLVSDSDQLPDADEAGTGGLPEGQVTLMTVHTAKGLEFPVVFVTGMEDGTFPHVRSLSEEADLAEERRLAYVALTRARERLYLTRAAVRSAWGTTQAMPASRFLDDLPAEVVDWRRLASDTVALYSDSTGWGSSWGEGGYGSGRRGARGGPGRRAGADRGGEPGESPAHLDEDDFAPPVGSGNRRTGRLGRVETAKDRAEARRAERAARRGRPTRLDGSPGRPRGRSGQQERGRVGAGDEAGRSQDEALPAAVAGLRVGDQVRHDSYGIGTVVGLEGAGRSLTARVEFTVAGAVTTKRLMLRYAPVARV